MSDFLFNLAAQALGQSAGLQPRLPSRFERFRSGRTDEGSPDPEPSNETPPRVAINQGAFETPPESVQPGMPPRPETPRASRPKPVGTLLPVETVTTRSAVASEKSTATGRNPPGRSTIPSPTPSIQRARAERAPSSLLGTSTPVRPAARAGADEGRPVIHVSIGRVEVRAVQRAESAPTPAKSVVTHRESLSAYLRGRRCNA